MYENRNPGCASYGAKHRASNISNTSIGMGMGTREGIDIGIGRHGRGPRCGQVSARAQAQAITFIIYNFFISYPDPKIFSTTCTARISVSI